MLQQVKRYDLVVVNYPIGVLINTKLLPTEYWINPIQFGTLRSIDIRRVSFKGLC